MKLSEMMMRAGIQLRKSGKEFRCRCPFHDDSTPSMFVNDDKGVYHCFGCGAKGNVYTFARDFLSVTGDELERIKLEMEQKSHASSDRQYTVDPETRKRLAHVIETFHKDSMKYLLKCYDYIYFFKERNIPKSWIEQFGIGLAPTKTKLVDWQKRNQFSTEDLKTIGLFSKENDIFLFERRLLFPIENKFNVKGFAGRSLINENMTSKYINSPRTPLFNKRTALFMPNEFNNSTEHIFIVEGYLDAIALAEKNLCAAAIMSTHMTKEQAERIAKLAPRKITLMFDNDEPGQQGAMRAAVLLLNQNIPIEAIHVAINGFEKNCKDAFDARNMGSLDQIIESTTRLDVKLLARLAKTESKEVLYDKIAGFIPRPNQVFEQLEKNERKEHSHDNDNSSSPNP